MDRYVYLDERRSPFSMTGLGQEYPERLTILTRQSRNQMRSCQLACA